MPAGKPFACENTIVRALLEEGSRPPAATIARAKMLADKGNTEAMELADVFCRESRERIEASFKALYGKHDAALYKLAQRVVKGEHAWLEQGIVDEAVLAARVEPVVAREMVGV